MRQITPRLSFIHLLEKKRPQAVAWVRGKEANPQLSGLIKFYATPHGGVLVEAMILLHNLPEMQEKRLLVV